MADIAVLGGRGMLGTDLVECLSEKGISTDVYDLPDFDILDYGNLKNIIDDHGIIFNCAAYTDVNGAEKEFDKAYKVNAAAVGKIAKLAKSSDSKVFHISTDFVFDGRSEQPYKENDIPNPINSYGVTKHAGEQLLSHSGCLYCIVRVEWTYGKNGYNFVKKIINKAKSGNHLKVVDDQIGSPTYTKTVSEMLYKLMESEALGLYHLACSDYASRYDVAKYILDKTNTNSKIERCKTSDFPSPVKRPLNSRFDCTKIRRKLEVEIPSWKDTLKKFLETL